MRAGPRGRQGEPGPPLLSDKDQALALRLAGIGDDGVGLVS